MVVHFVVETPVKKFLEFLPRVSNIQAPIVDFSDVPEGKGNKESMYKPFKNAVDQSDVCPSFKLLNTSSREDPVVDIKPDVGLFPVSVGTKTATISRMEVFVEIKQRGQQDAFRSTVNSGVAVQQEAKEAKEGQPLLETSIASIKHRGQQIEYTNQIMTLQHRIHLFSISIIGHYARLICWDRAGACVSECFNYHDGSNNWIGEFLFRYANATPEQRGFDPNVKRATAKEVAALTKAVNVHLSKFDYHPHRRAELEKTADPSYPVYRVCVKDQSSNKVSQYIICRPFFEVSSLCSQATRGYLALPVCNRTKLVFFKDTWRPDIEGMLSEAEIYAILRGNEELLPLLPVVLACGDVLLSGGQVQCTKTQDSAEDNQWVHHSARLRKLTRHRVIQELAFPLHMVQNSKQLLGAVRNTLEVIKLAYHEFGILHRDISVGNVMLNMDFAGILNDWDHAIRANVTRQGHPYRTGTWQFMSIGILRNATKPHTIHDDIESAFWVFYYIALHHFKLSPESSKSSRLTIKIFDEKDVESGKDGRVIYSGGDIKSSSLTSGEINEVKFESVPITEALHQFAGIVADYRGLQEARLRGRKAAAAEAAYSEQVIEKVDGIIKIFNDIIDNKNTKWPENPNDAVEDQFPKTTVMEDHRRMTTDALHSFSVAHRGVGTSGHQFSKASGSGMLPPTSIPAGHGSTSSVGIAVPGGSTIASGFRASSRSNSKRRADDEGVDLEESGSKKRVKKLKKGKKEQKGKQGSSTPMRYFTRLQSRLGLKKED
ncbi:hypothetical protein BDY19DRAFT_89279 [Irpex rosettiformis]|uniref:Uncharacterized protein n=1 Tax=Irpex rosettiformis TaxID=378272 RepID=A0ACB8U6U7_9APHY|nr:hypothetical protein BDY19DRAFT_89279 [Irpex rosettiformis]